MTLAELSRIDAANLAEQRMVNIPQDQTFKQKQLLPQVKRWISWICKSESYGKGISQEQHYAVSHKGVLFHIKEAHYNSKEYYIPIVVVECLNDVAIFVHGTLPMIGDMPTKHKRTALMRHIYMDMQNYV